jgi:DNA topoisomerase-2
MHAFDGEIKLKKFQSVNEIVDEFYGIRLAGYEKRKLAQLEEMQRKLVRASNKMRFILCVLDGSVDLRFKHAKETDELLHGAGFKKLGDSTNEDVDLGSFSYLTRMPMNSVNTDKVEVLRGEKDSLEVSIRELENTSIEVLWKGELDVLRELIIKSRNAVLLGVAERSSSANSLSKVGTKREREPIDSSKKPVKKQNVLSFVTI